MIHRNIFTLIAIIFIGCGKQLYFNYNPHNYIDIIKDNEKAKTFYDVQDIPKNIIKGLRNSAKINFVLANPNDNYHKSSNIINNNLAFRKLIFYERYANNMNIICYEAKGYQKRAIICKLINGKIMGAFDIQFESDNINYLNYKEHLNNNDFKIVTIYN